jgi:hypothetical protein
MRVLLRHSLPPSADGATCPRPTGMTTSPGGGHMNRPMQQQGGLSQGATCLISVAVAAAVAAAAVAAAAAAAAAVLAVL